MKIFSANVEDLRTLYISNLKKALDMEQKIVDALPDMVEAASEPSLATAFSNHLEESRSHVTKVQQLLQNLTDKVDTETCKVINGLTAEASDTIKDVTEPSIRDIALIGAGQQVEHHEIAVYGTLRHWANLLNLTEDVAVLTSIEKDEINADKMLTSISTRVNQLAAA